MSENISKENILSNVLEYKVEKKTYVSGGPFPSIEIYDALIDKDGNEICRLDIPQAVFFEKIIELEKRILELESKIL